MSSLQRPRRAPRLLYTGVLLAFLTGCGGGSVNSYSTALPAPVKAGNATLAVTIVVPRIAPSGARRPGYVSASTQSATISVGPAGGKTTDSVVLACATTCSGTIGAPIGNDSITVSLYAGVAGSGALLSSGTATVTALAGTAEAVGLTFNPVANSMSLGLSAPALNAGSPGNSTLTLTAKDAAGNIIVGPGSFIDANGNPLTIALGVARFGGPGGITLSTNQITDPAHATSTVTYDGQALYGATFSLAPSSTISGSVTGTTLAIAPAAHEYSNSITAGSHPYGIATGPDGNLWFTEESADQIARITPGGTVTEFPVPTPAAQPQGITAGPDGALWFTENFANKIGRITTTGSVTEYAAGTSPYAIVSGPDGNLWFTEYGDYSIGRITPAGVVTYWLTTTAFSYPYGLAVGPDGNLWFTEVNANKIGRITTSGAITEFSAGISANADPNGIVAGSDNNLWFTEYTGSAAGNKIGRITTAGTVTEFSTGISPGAGPLNIAGGSDGNLWFTEHDISQFARITTGGAVTEFSAGMSSATNPTAITSGPDGNLWFTEHATNAIGRVVY